MTNTLSKERLDSITPAMVRDYKRVKKIIANLDIGNGDWHYRPFLEQGMAMRKLGYSFKEIERQFEDRLNV